MNNKERTDYVYHAMAELIGFIDPKNAVMIEVQDAYGAHISFNPDSGTESKLKALLEERGFSLTDGEESVIYSKDIEEFGASVILSKSKANPKINLSITV